MIPTHARPGALEQNKHVFVEKPLAIERMPNSDSLSLTRPSQIERQADGRL